MTKPYKTQARTLDPDGDSFLYNMAPRKPWLVSVRGFKVGRYATQEEARAARDAYLGRTRTPDTHAPATPTP